MRRVFGFVAVLALVLGVVGSAAAENGTVDPFKAKRVKTMENGTIDPFSPTGK